MYSGRNVLDAHCDEHVRIGLHAEVVNRADVVRSDILNFQGDELIELRSPSPTAFMLST